MANQLRLEVRQVGPWQMNAYGLICPVSKESVLIDPGGDPEILIDMLAGTQPVAILLTHTHPDHTGALDAMRERLGAPLMLHPGPHYEGIEMAADRWLHDGDVIRIGEKTIRVYHVLGHIDDQVCYALWNNDQTGDLRIIVGDTIFEGGPGKTWSAEGFRTTLQTIRDIVLAWPDDAVLYPGHGPSFRLGDIRADVEAFLQKDHGDFYGDATW
ncbi:MAG: MBL fold metallo-hydrolase [Anaerolineales bacterium]|nr:MBL fold metallo-hydrolase [Anaerolineales bacterium]